MATVTGLTAERMLEIEGQTVVDGDVIDGELILIKHDGSTLNAGSVVGPPGPEGPIGSDLDVLVEHAILDVGVPGQIRAGRALTVEDFENIGLDAPIGLWNFSNNYNDESGNGHNFSTKGSPQFVRGIDGSVSSAVIFNGSSALYIEDTGAADPFRIRVGSFGAWVRTARKGAMQTIMSKRAASAERMFWLRIRDTDVINFGVGINATSGYWELTSLSRVCDDRWHFIVGTYDGILQNLYVDGVLEASQLRGATAQELMYGSSEPLNIGSYAVDSASSTFPEAHFGRVDTAFITSEILSQEKVYNLYCAKVPHTLGEIPSGVSLSVHPGAKGASLVAGDFPAPPLRLYNFSAGAITNEGTTSGVALTPVASPLSVSGVDGTKGNAYAFNGSQRFTAPDTGLPAGTNPLAYGCWFKTSNGTSNLLYILNYGAGASPGASDTRVYLVDGVLQFATGAGAAIPGPFVADGLWHFVAVVHDPSDLAGNKRKFYLDGRLVASSTGLNSITLGGTARFVIGSSFVSTGNFIGQIDTVWFVDYVMTLGDVNALYVKSLYEHLPSPKNAGDHVELMSDTDLLVAFDTLDIAHKISLKVMA